MTNQCSMKWLFVVWLSMKTAVTLAVPPDPMSDGFDWIQFNNGEWLKGKIDDVQDTSFVFDSDELDELSLGFDDLYAVYSSRTLTVFLDDKTVLRGTLKIEGDDVTITTVDGPQRLHRSDLRGVIPGGLSEKEYWSLKFSLGITARSGNTEQEDYATLLFVQRRTPGSRTRVDYTGAYGRVQNVETINSQRAQLRHDIYMTRRFSLVLPSFEYYRDKFQNVAGRYTSGLGLGYELIDKSSLEWGIGGGGGYQQTRYYAVEQGEANDDGMAVLLGSTDLSWDLTKRLEINLQYNVTAGLKSGGSTNHHTLAVFALELWKNLDLDLSVTWDHASRPQARADGSIPKQDDVRTFVGIGWEF